MTLADRITLARLGIAPLAAAAWLVLPIDHAICFWVCGWLCAAAEFTDWIDGKVARARGEVSDFGKLADPFCDVVYRMLLFLVFLLPAGGVGYAVATGQAGHTTWASPLVFTVDAAGTLGTGALPFLPVLLMVLRELLAGALRAMTAAKGLILAARTSGKVKAWFQGLTIVAVCALPGLTFRLDAWHLPALAIAAWVCAAISIGSFIEYLFVNRVVLRELVRNRKDRREDTGR